jgi:hypothetical protein
VVLSHSGYFEQVNGAIIMAPNSASQKIETEEVLQAVIVADSFDERFMPLTLDKPRVF